MISCSCLLIPRSPRPRTSDSRSLETEDDHAEMTTFQALFANFEDSLTKQRRAFSSLSLSVFSLTEELLQQFLLNLEVGRSLALLLEYLPVRKMV